MTFNRRKFLGGCTAAAAIAGLPGCGKLESVPSGGHWANRAGIQLYTFDKEIKADMGRVFETVAALGYKEVEFVGAYINQPAKNIRAMLDAAGLRAPSGHIGYEDFSDEAILKRSIDNAKEMGYNYLLLPWLYENDRKTLDQYRRLADEFSGWGQTCQDNGLSFAYHNHAFEFEPIDGEKPYDVLLGRTDAKLVDMELDLGWIEFSGNSAVDYITAHPGRFPLFHVKDFNAEKKLCPAGQGVVDFAEIFKVAEVAGLQHAYFEQDNPSSARQSAAESFEYLKSLSVNLPNLRSREVGK